jgi:hypothetical protein
METYLKVTNSHVRLQRQQVLPQINQFSDYLKLEIVTVVKPQPLKWQQRIGSDEGFKIRSTT